MRRWVLVAVVVGLVVLSGCISLADDDPTGDIDEQDADTDDSQRTDNGSDGGTETDSDTGDDDTDNGGTDPPPGDLEIHHIDVGQADSTLLVTPEGETVLVDTGNWQPDGERVIGYLEARGIERIDHLVATHPHADHIGGHAAVIEYFEENGDGIGAVYDPGVPHDTQTYESYLDAVDAYGHDLFVVGAGDRLPLGSDGVEALVLNPPAGESGGDLHASSIALAVEFGDVRYLLTGDAESETEARLVAEWADELDADVYQAGHHGSSTSSTGPFLDAVDPEVAVISSDYDSQFGHPHEVVLERLADRGVETYWTGVHGDVVVTTDGTDVEVTPDESFATDPMDLLAEKPGEGRAARMTAVAGTEAHPARGVG